MSESSELKNRDRAAPPLRILYVEDNSIVREVTAELLCGEDRLIVAKENAEEALQEFHLQPFDLVITDVSLPHMSGMDLARAIMAAKSDTPIIIASGYFIDLTEQNWTRLVRSIVKPFSAADIDALIAELCPR